MSPGNLLEINNCSHIERKLIMGLTGPFCMVYTHLLISFSDKSAEMIINDSPLYRGGNWGTER